MVTIPTYLLFVAGCRYVGATSNDKVGTMTALGYHLADTLRKNDVVITSRRRHFDVITSKLRRFDVKTTLLLCHVFIGCSDRNLALLHSPLFIGLFHRVSLGSCAVHRRSHYVLAAYIGLCTLQYGTVRDLQNTQFMNRWKINAFINTFMQPFINT